MELELELEPMLTFYRTGGKRARDHCTHMVEMAEMTEIV
jgi:hypothetical protein